MLMDSKLALLAIMAVAVIFSASSIIDTSFAETEETPEDEQSKEYDESSCPFKKAKSNLQINNPNT